MTKIKRNFLLTALLLAMGVGLYHLPLYRNRYSMEIVKVDDGYGYKIYQDQKPYIFQPFIPVVAGKYSFGSEKDAEQVGRLVLDRLSKGEDFSVTMEDLNRLGIASH